MVSSMIPVAEVMFFDVVLFFHILAVVLAFGPTFAYALFLGVAQREGGRSIPTVGRSIVQWDSTVGTAGALVILASGIYMAADRWDFSDFFISWGILAVIVIVGVVHAVMIPTTRKAVAAAERDIAGAGPGEVTFSEEFNNLNRKLAQFGTALGLLVILTLYFMSAKPFL